MHGPLSKQNRHAFTRSGLFELLEKPDNLAVAEQIAALFLAKFDPSKPLTGDALEARRKEVVTTIDGKIAVSSIEAQTLLNAMLNGAMKVTAVALLATGVSGVPELRAALP